MRAFLIFNPAAGSGRIRKELEAAAGRLAASGWDLAWRETASPDDVTRWSRAAAEAGADALFVAGGDGTINHALPGLLGSDTALGVLPMGTANVLSLQLGLPLPSPLNPNALIQAAEHLCRGTVRRMDAGRLFTESGPTEGRPFLCWAGVGLDAEVTANVENQPELKRRLGKGAFVLLGVQLLLRRVIRSARMTLICDGRPLERQLIMAVACNIRLWAGEFQIAPDARVDDGLLNVAAFEGRSLGQLARHAAVLAARRHTRQHDVLYRQVREIEIRSGRPLAVHTDGEPSGTTPSRILVEPQAIAILVPATAPATLWSQPSALKVAA